MPKEEKDVWDLFDSLKEKYGRDIFGQGFVFKIVDRTLLADLDSLTDDEKENGIAGTKTFVPYDKGDKEGNRWFFDNPFVINDVTEQAKAYAKWVNDNIWDLNRMQKEPDEIQVEPGTCCTAPYECWYYRYCHS